MLIDSRLIQFEDGRRQVLYRVALIVGAVVLVGVGARIRIPLEPVPITFQVLAVLLAGLLLSPTDALISQATYVGLIATGLPLDANGLGTAALIGPTGGYLIGFVAAAPIIAWLSGLARVHGDRLRWVAVLAGIAIIYLGGAHWLSMWLNLYGDMSLAEARTAAWAVGVAPFIWIDLSKAVAAVLIASGAQRRLGLNRS